LGVHTGLLEDLAQQRGCRLLSRFQDAADHRPPAGVGAATEQDAPLGIEHHGTDPGEPEQVGADVAAQGGDELRDRHQPIVADAAQSAAGPGPAEISGGTGGSPCPPAPPALSAPGSCASGPVRRSTPTVTWVSSAATAPTATSTGATAAVSTVTATPAVSGISSRVWPDSFLMNTRRTLPSRISSRTLATRLSPETLNSSYQVDPWPPEVPLCAPPLPGPLLPGPPGVDWFIASSSGHHRCRSWRHRSRRRTSASQNRAPRARAPRSSPCSRPRPGRAGAVPGMRLTPLRSDGGGSPGRGSPARARSPPRTCR